MKHNLILIITLFFAGTATGAEPIDSLLTHLDERISECLDDATRLDEGYELIQQALSLKGVEDSRLYPVMRFHEGTYYMGKGDVNHWKQNRLQLLQELPFEGWEEMSISVPQELGLICRREGKIDSALFYYDEALQEARRQGDLEWLAAISANVGLLHYNMSHFKEAEQYLQQGLEYVRQVDDPYTELCLLQTNGAVKVTLDKLQEAEPLLQEAYQMATEAESPDWQLRCLTTMMPMYDKLGLPDSSLACQQRGDALLPLLPQQGITAIGFITARANHFYDTGQWAQAVSDFETVVANAAGGVKTAAIFERMARSYAQLNRWQEAFCYMDSARIEADTLASERLTAQMAEFNARYQTMEKDLQIARLQTQRLWTAIAAIAILLLVAVFSVYYRMRRQRREAQMRIGTLEEERSRIAKELHDGLCNDMLALEMRMQGDGAAQFSDQLNTLRQQARQLSHRLMPPEFTHLSIHFLLRQLMTLTQDNTRLNVHYEAQPDDESLWRQLPPAVSHEVYRIVQELTSNIVKGATATCLSVSLQQTAPGRYRLTIIDDGQPGTSIPDNSHDGLGHRTQHDRIVSLGARADSYRRDGENHFELEFTA